MSVRAYFLFFSATFGRFKRSAMYAASGLA
jgi:hypothetical protein